MIGAEVRVGDVLELRRREVIVDPLQDYTLIGIYSFGKGIFHRDPKPGSELGDYRYFRIEPGDLVLSNIQAWEGAIGFARDVDRGTVGTHRFLPYTASDGRVDPNWLRWFLLSEPGMSLIRSAAPGTTARNRTLAIDRFENLKIPAPPVERQRSTAERLDRIADLVTRVAELRVRAAALRQGLAHALIARASDSAELHRFGDLFELVRRPVEVDASATYQEIGVRSFGRGIFHKEPKSGADIGSKRVFRIQAGDLVISNVFGWEGAVAVAGEAEAGLIGSHRFMTWVPRSDSVRVDWAARFLTSPSGIEGLRQASPGSAGRNRTLAIARLEDVLIAVPSPETQLEVASRLRSIEEISNLSESADVIERVVAAAVLNQEFGGGSIR